MKIHRRNVHGECTEHDNVSTNSFYVRLTHCSSQFPANSHEILGKELDKNAQAARTECEQKRRFPDSACKAVSPEYRCPSHMDVCVPCTCYLKRSHNVNLLLELMYVHLTNPPVLSPIPSPFFHTHPFVRCKTGDHG